MTAVDHAELERVVARLRATAGDYIGKADRAWCIETHAADAITALLSEIEGLKAERPEAKPWQDREDEWSEAISAAHPCNSDHPWKHKCFETAMEMVGNRRGKYELVALVSWLLSDLQYLRTQAPDSWRPDREAVARIVDGWAFDHPTVHYQHLAKRRDKALTRADAILALRPQTAESGT